MIHKFRKFHPVALALLLAAAASMPARAESVTLTHVHGLSYSADGKQYIAIAAGLGGGSPRNVPAAVAPEIKIPQAGQALYVFTLP